MPSYWRASTWFQPLPVWRPSHLPAGTPAGTYTVLTLPQPPESVFYPYTVDVWREVVNLGADGQPGTPPLIWSRVFNGQRCYADLNPNRHQAAAFLQMEDDGMDAFHFPSTADIQTTDVIKLTGYPNPAFLGLFWRVRGDPERHDWIAGKQIVQVHTTVPPDGVS